MKPTILICLTVLLCAIMFNFTLRYVADKICATIQAKMAADYGIATFRKVK